MKREFKSFEIVLPKIMYSNVISLTEKNVCKRERNPLLKMVEIRKNTYEKNLMKRTINYKDEGILKKTFLIKPKTYSIVTVNTFNNHPDDKEYTEVKKINALNNNNFTNKSKCNDEKVKGIKNSPKRIVLLKKTNEKIKDLDFKFYYKNKSIDLLLKTKCKYNQLFKN